MGKLKDDLLAGITVAIVALPLSMALAIASGVSPDKGLITAIVAGFFISLLGGSRYQIGGPTGAFVVVIFNVIQEFGYEGLVVANIMAGLFLIIAGLLRFGTYIKYIPHPVVTGFTSGIATIIFISQISDFLGLKLNGISADIFSKLAAISSNLQDFDTAVLLSALMSLAIILIIRKKSPKLPAFLFAILAVSSCVYLFSIPVETIGSKFGGISAQLPSPELPAISFELLQKLLPSAFTIAFLAGIESLLSAVVADGMSGTKHRSNCELVAQGVANIASPLLGGIPATGAIARTATNIRSGAHSPISGIIHAFVLLLFMMLLAPLASFIPIACLSAILMVVAWNMSEFDKFIHLFKAPLGDRFVLVITYVLTVTVDLNLAIEVGFILSTVMFMHRMAGAVYVQTHQNILQEDVEDRMEDEHPFPTELPKGVLSYNFNGPFFFGAAERLIETLTRTGETPKVIILEMKEVPFIDSTGSTALGTFISQSIKSGVWLIFTGCNPQVLHSLEKMNSLSQKPNIMLSPHFQKSLELSIHLTKELFKESSHPQ